MVLLAIYHTTTGFVLRSVLILASEAGGLDYSRLGGQASNRLGYNQGGRSKETASVNGYKSRVFLTQPPR
jgi:hypothetical protein